MRILLGLCTAVVLMSSGALADGTRLSGSLWMCTRAVDRSQFVITFYPGGGVGGGEFRDSEVSPYVFDASGMKNDQWPGQWEQKGMGFTWAFPDQHMEITGAISGSKQRRQTLIGAETGPEMKSPITCKGLSKLPRIGEGLVIPKDGRFMELDGQDGLLKIPVGISLQERRAARRIR
jgi:hypothetical protein